MYVWVGISGIEERPKIVSCEVNWFLLKGGHKKVITRDIYNKLIKRDNDDKFTWTWCCNIPVLEQSLLHYCPLPAIHNPLIVITWLTDFIFFFQKDQIIKIAYCSQLSRTILLFSKSESWISLMTYN